MTAFVYTKNGWLSQTSQFVTDRAQARSFTIDEAIAAATRLHSNGMMAVPVRLDDIGYMP